MIISVKAESPVILEIASPIGIDEFIRNNTDIASDIVNITLVNGSFPDEVEICFDKTERSRGKTSDVCLGYLDELDSPPTWKCVDKCVKEKDNKICGTTDHFTNFAILLGGAGGDCGDDAQYVTGDATGDLLLVLGLVVLFFAICVMVYVIVTYVPFCHQFFYGFEGSRVRSLRHTSREYVTLTRTS